MWGRNLRQFHLHGLDTGLGDAHQVGVDRPERQLLILLKIICWLNGPDIVYPEKFNHRHLRIYQQVFLKMIHQVWHAQQLVALSIRKEIDAEE